MRYLSPAAHHTAKSKVRELDLKMTVHSEWHVSETITGLSAHAQAWTHLVQAT